LFQVRTQQQQQQQQQISFSEERTKPLQELANKIVEQTKQVTEDLKIEYEEFAKQRSLFEKEQQTSLKYILPEGIIELNVGGQIFTTTKSTLLKAEGTMLGAMFSGRYELGPKDKEGRIFIDRPSQWFSIMLDSLRSGTKIVLPTEEEDLEEFKREVKFYSMENYFKTQFKDPKFIGTDATLLLKQIYVDLLNKWTKATSKDKNWKLEYKASKDGWDAVNFHSKVDNKGESISVIEDTDGNLFGGYTPIQWKSSGNYLFDNRTFIFSLKNPLNQPIMLKNNGPQANNQYSIYDLSTYGPTFGGGHDIFISSNSNTQKTNYCNLGHSFDSPSGMSFGDEKIKNFLCGNYNFQVKEIEVYCRKDKKKIINYL